MTLEVQRVPEDSLGLLRNCLVEGDPQSEKRARRIKQRAVAVSIVLQSVALTALVLFPLLSKGERIAIQVMTPLPPFPAGNHKPADPPGPRGSQTAQACHICPGKNIPLNIVIHDSTVSQTPGENAGETIVGFPDGLGVPGSAWSPTARPVAPPPPPDEPVRLNRSELQQMAQLISRIEPRYPPLAIQIRHEGRVELHAIISTTGTIESLEVISGDPIFLQSALSAVRQWRYRPTILNGRPIEVDTHITVIYTLSH